MPRRLDHAGTLVLLALVLGAAGCTTISADPPPAVAPQPPEMTAREATIEERLAVAQDTAAEAPAEAPAATTPQVAAAPTRSERARPTARSTQEILALIAAAPRTLDFGQRLDQAHDRVYAWGQSVVDATDRSFASENKPLKPVPAAPFRLTTTMELLDRNDGLRRGLHLDFDIYLRLPNLEEKLRFFITSDELDSGVRQRAADSQLRAGLRYEFLHNLDFDVGIRVAIPPVAFAALRWTREVTLGKWDFYPLVKLFAETKQSVGYSLGATFDRWSGRTLLRSSSYAKWRHDQSRTQWSQTFVYARAHELLVPDRYGSYTSADDIGRGWGLRESISGEHKDQVTRYESGLFYRNRTPLRWLYWSVEPFVRWDRPRNWSADPGIYLRIDALFWDLVRPAQ